MLKARNPDGDRLRPSHKAVGRKSLRFTGESGWEGQKTNRLKTAKQNKEFEKVLKEFQKAGLTFYCKNEEGDDIYKYKTAYLSFFADAIDEKRWELNAFLTFNEGNISREGLFLIFSVGYNGLKKGEAEEDVRDFVEELEKQIADPEDMYTELVPDPDDPNWEELVWEDDEEEDDEEKP